MTEKEFKKYEGCKTTCKMMSYDLDGGVVVGYDPSDDDMCIIVKVMDHQGWKACPGEYKFATEKDLNDYRSGKYRYLYVKPEYVVTDIDLTSILKGCEGIELWSDIFGKCKLESLVGDGDYEIVVLVLNTIPYENEYEQFTKYGRYYDCYPNGKCMLWPSETNRDWSTFVAPVKVRDDDWVACTNIPECGACVIKYGNISESWKYIIPYDKFRLDLTEEELNNLNINKK